MLIHQLPKNNDLFSVTFTKYAENHYLKNFKKKYKGRQWDTTERSIILDLSRLRMQNNTTQATSQIDELNFNNNEYLAKYDFKIALTNESSKTSGNRCIIYINNEKNIIKILMIYNKNDLPKNKKETSFIMKTIETNDFGVKLDKLIKVM